MWCNSVALYPPLLLGASDNRAETQQRRPEFAGGASQPGGDMHYVLGLAVGENLIWLTSPPHYY